MRKIEIGIGEQKNSVHECDEMRDSVVQESLWAKYIECQNNVNEIIQSFEVN